jgi:Pro-kumamolisin, activation domain/IPT/TIG domain/PASTA domain
MKRYLGVRALVAAPLVALACFTISASAGAAGPSGTRMISRAPRLPNGARVIGPLSSSTTVSGVVVLRPRDEGALTRFIAKVTDKKSALFHHYLTPGTFAQKFGPTPSSIASVTSQLRAKGLSVQVARDGMIVRFRAPADKAEAAFGTGLEKVRLAGGAIGQARTGAIRLPATIAAKVAAVVGLDNLVRYHSSSVLRPTKAAAATHAAAKTSSFIHPAGSPTACSDAQQAAQEFGGLTDDQIANAYGAFGLYGQGDFGAGQHVGIFELEPFATDDIQTFDTCYFGATAASDMISRLNTVPVDGGQPQGPGGGEATLDIQDVSAFAPGANIDVYEAPNTTFGSFDMYAQMVNDNTDQIISSSWGLCEQAVQEGSPGVQQAENLVFQQAAAQGQSVFSAAGDNGDNDCNAFRTTAPVDPVLSVDDPSSQPYVVAVGGTTIDNATQDPLEHVWNDGAAWGSTGGGISESWPAPSWQLSSLVPGGISDSGNQDTVSAAENFMSTGFCLSDSPGGGFESACRQLPDVSAQADEFTGAITIFVGELGFGWTTIGGTSSSAPMWAALLADINESSTCQNNGLGSAGVGFVSPLLYTVASNPTSYAASFNDITTGNNDQYGISPSGGPALYGATTGYDMASGLGTPALTQPGDQPGLAAYLCNEAPSITKPTISNVSPGFGPTNNNTNVTITGTNFEDNGVPDVSSVAVGSFVIPSFAVNVTSATTIDVTFPPSAADVTPPNDQTDGAGRYQVTVTLSNSETTAPNANSWFTFVDENGSSQPVPSVTGVHTYGGPESGGNTVTILGAGFTGATDVTFGGVSVGGGNFTVVNDWKITATVPAYSGINTTCDQDGSSFDASQNATNDICQTQVVVTNPNGSSATSTILPLYEGAFAFNEHGAIPAPPGEEAAPAATEYDYFPEPTITSVSTDIGNAGSLASELGSSIITIDGTGFNLAGLASISFGDSTQEFSQATFGLVNVTGTEIQIFAPGIAETTDPATVPINIQTLGDPTATDQGDATYAGVPSVGQVAATAGPTAGLPGGPDTGGTPIEVGGAGFQDQSLVVLFNDVASPFSFGTQYNFDVNADDDLTTNTVAQNPALVDVQVCTVTDCSFPTSLNNDPSDEFFLFPPGAPKVDSISPTSGVSTGGTQVTITGENLGCVTGVFFGNTAAETFSNAQALLDCGSTNTVTVTAPPGTIGSTVPVTVTTVESDFTGDTPTTNASFTYVAPPNQTLTVSKAGSGSGTVTSAPAGIDCGTTCTHDFVFGTSVTLTATAGSHSHFSGWSGGGCSGTGTCTVTMNAAVSVTATFGANPAPPPPKACVVPKLKGKTLRAAKRSLKAHHCRLGRVRHAFSANVKKGHVISQKPKAGRHLRHLAKVNVTLSKGKKH